MTISTTTTPGPRAGAGILLLTVLALSACGEKLDDVNSEAACTNYCDKMFACDELDPTSDEQETCVSECRDTIENECGNDAQSGANTIIQECVDLACDDFWPCMVYEEAPECFDFVPDRE